MNSKIRILGIDPGLETTGVSILDVNNGKYQSVYLNCIITKKDKPASERLKEIYLEINRLIKEYRPDCMVVEEIFFNINTKTALEVGQARGVSILAGSINNIKIYEYTPLEVKQAITGYGRATKNQIKHMLKIILGVKEDFLPKKDDAWDAIAISVCHANNIKFKEKIECYNNNSGRL
ncbi:MAG: crossover junction endodeoxyribonuclease RuvC [Candidatus Humimicrobiaceae bacterium]|jgi:crossover junction endodeoxyribonuclease RuvC|nr:crossover junction endodeoxyribonuclease RuvC [Actinomycetota bacterium]MDD5600292.1 crossover junction endodeoxyribonuclease RuvC [Actinomycetota bacterium]MDY0027724.1 crossover junction endodeoxyribonuclease RuvC [Candidatus Humimicrobiaceae bacterium]